MNKPLPLDGEARRREQFDKRVNSYGPMGLTVRSGLAPVRDRSRTGIVPEWGGALLRVRTFPTVVVFQTDDIVLAQVVATLHLDNVHWLIVRIGDPMDVADGDIR